MREYEGGGRRRRVHGITDKRAPSVAELYGDFNSQFPFSAAAAREIDRRSPPFFIPGRPFFTFVIFRASRLAARTIRAGVAVGSSPGLYHPTVVRGVWGD